MTSLAEKLKPKEAVPSIFDNVRKVSQIVTFDDITILMINDFDKAYTPVIDLELLDATVSKQEDKVSKTSQMEVSVPMMMAAYYNLEVSQWEPLLESMSYVLVLSNSEQE